MSFITLINLIYLIIISLSISPVLLVIIFLQIRKINKLKNDHIKFLEKVSSVSDNNQKFTKSGGSYVPPNGNLPPVFDKK